MVNPTGANGVDNGVFPPDEELREILHDFQRRSLSLAVRLRYLEERHGIKIGKTKLKQLNNKFEVPSVRKFRAVEEATAAIANIISRDVNQGQGPDTVKKIASLRLNIIIPRDFVRSTMHALVGQGPSDMRRPGRHNRTGPKKRGALDAIGIFQEIHTMKMGDGIGIDIYGARDHVGKLLWLVVVPNARLSDTIGHVILDMVTEYKAVSVQVTFDGGSELGWLAAFQTTLRPRQEFAPRLSIVDWPPTVSVKSSSNISIESACLRDILEEGRIHLIPGNLIHSFLDYFNNQKTRKQPGRILPSGVAPNVVFDMPQDYGLENLAVPVAQEAIDALRGLIDTPRSEALRWVPDLFNGLAFEVYHELGSPKLEALNGWAVFNAMAPLIRAQVELHGLYEALLV
ncbi:hypothetical protein R3P38DRAFT_3515958 [Favolaschia claudopus]|uniref:Uncharacterized protein n=1 Tax=Favolaschia claudopus TaxID=2862362 RepID=A0AAW0BS65_9AGAR